MLKVMTILATFFCSMTHSYGRDIGLDNVLKIIDTIKPEIINAAQKIRQLDQLINTQHLAEIFKSDPNIGNIFQQESRQALDEMSYLELVHYLNSITVYCGVDMGPIARLMDKITGEYIEVDMTFFGNSIYSKNILNDISIGQANLLGHEVIHGLQEKGTVPLTGLNQSDSYLLNYILASLDTIAIGKSYMNNRFEIEAYEIGGRSWSYLNQHMGLWYKKK